jgi:hypothetical protein
MSAVQLLKLRARFLWGISFKPLLGRRFGLQNGRKLPRFFMFGTVQLYTSRPNAWVSRATAKLPTSWARAAE